MSIKAFYLSIYPSVDKGYFFFVSIVNNARVDIDWHSSLYSKSFVHTSMSVIARSYINF
jgi:hypothetical protein